MRERHFPRLCRSCDAPMARQEDTCWSCEASWDYRSAGATNVVRVRPRRSAARRDARGQKELPMEYAVETNPLIEPQMKGSIG